MLAGMPARDGLVLNPLGGIELQKMLRVGVTTSATRRIVSRLCSTIYTSGACARVWPSSFLTEQRESENVHEFQIFEHHAVCTKFCELSEA